MRLEINCASGPVDPPIVDRIISGLITHMPNFGVQDYFSGKRSMFDDSDYTVFSTLSDTKSVNALLVAKWMFLKDYRVLLVRTALMGERWHSTLLLRNLWKSLFLEVLRSETPQPTCIAFTTYNPKSYTTLLPFARIPDVSIYPSIARSVSRAWNDIHIIEEIASALFPGRVFDSKTGIIRRGAHPSAVNFYSARPKSRMHSVNHTFEEQLTNEDRILCAIRFHSSEAWSDTVRMFGIRQPVSAGASDA